MRLVVLGRPGVGKSTWVRALATGRFDPSAAPSVIVEHETLEVPGSSLGVEYFDPVPVHVFVAPGKDGTLDVEASCRMVADCVIVCYDVTAPESFLHCGKILRQFRAVHSQRAEDNTDKVPAAIVGLKADDCKFPEIAGMVSYSDVERVSEEQGCTDFLVSVAAGFRVWDPIADVVLRACQMKNRRPLLPAHHPVHRGVHMSVLAAPTPSAGDHVVDVVAPDGSPYTSGPLAVARPFDAVVDRGLWHRTAHVWLMDLSTGAVLVQRKSHRHYKWPNVWTPTSVGEVLAREEANAAGQRLVRDQTGIIVVDAAEQRSLTMQQLWAAQGIDLQMAVHRESLPERHAAAEAFLHEAEQFDLGAEFVTNPPAAMRIDDALTQARLCLTAAGQSLQQAGEALGANNKQASAGHRREALQATSDCFRQLLSVGDHLAQDAVAACTKPLVPLFTEKLSSQSDGLEYNEFANVYLLPCERAPGLVKVVDGLETASFQYFALDKLVQNLREGAQGWFPVSSAYVDRLERALHQASSEYLAAME